MGFAKCAMTENRVLNCGYQQAPSIGIGASQQLGEIVRGIPEVMNTGVSPDNTTISAPRGCVIADLILEARVQSNLITYANAALLDANQEHRALWMRGWLEQAITLGSGQLVFGFSAQILDNKFLGPAGRWLSRIAQQNVSDNLFRRFERLFFSNNFCWHARRGRPGDRYGVALGQERDCDGQPHQDECADPVRGFPWHEGGSLHGQSGAGQSGEFRRSSVADLWVQSTLEAAGCGTCPPAAFATFVRVSREDQQLRG